MKDLRAHKTPKKRQFLIFCYYGNFPKLDLEALAHLPGRWRTTIGQRRVGRQPAAVVSDRMTTELGGKLYLRANKTLGHTKRKKKV